MQIHLRASPGGQPERYAGGDKGGGQRHEGVPFESDPADSECCTGGEDDGGSAKSALVGLHAFSF